MEGKEAGEYDSKIEIGMFLPLLPKNVMSMLAKKSYWLALVVTSLIPGLPIMLYPLINTGMRRITVKMIRNKIRRFRYSCPVYGELVQCHA